MNVLTPTPLHRWTFAALAAIALACTGCPRVLHLDYQPSTQLKGSGPVRVDLFAYAGHPTGLMKQKELETGAGDVEALYLSQDIGEFFTGALTRELALAGYAPAPESGRIVSGTIEHFFLDYVGQNEQRFQMRATMNVARKDAPPFVTSCRSDRQQAKDWMKSGWLIERGVKDCIDEFLHNAQAAGAL